MAPCSHPGLIFSCSTGRVEAYETSATSVAAPAGRIARLLRGGTRGNARLTASTGVLILALLAVEGVTLLSIRSMLSLHIFVGLMLIPPIALKLASTGYRFVRYYTRDREYLRQGPPMLLMRLLVAPGLVAATVGLFATGITLLVIGPEGGVALGLHKASFVVWIGALGIHVLAYAARTPQLVAADWGRRAGVPGTTLRYGLVALALVLGLIVAIAALPADGSWLHWSGGGEH
jgi:hypothetical protein